MIFLDLKKNYIEDFTDSDGVNIRFCKLTDSDFKKQLKQLIDNKPEGIFKSVCLITHSVEITPDDLSTALKNYGQNIDLLLKKKDLKVDFFVDKICKDVLEKTLSEYKAFMERYSVEFTLHQIEDNHHKVSTSKDFTFIYVPEKKEPKRPKGNKI